MHVNWSPIGLIYCKRIKPAMIFVRLFTWNVGIGKIRKRKECWITSPDVFKLNNSHFFCVEIFFKTYGHSSPVIESKRSFTSLCCVRCFWLIRRRWVVFYSHLVKAEWEETAKKKNKKYRAERRTRADVNKLWCGRKYQVIYCVLVGGWTFCEMTW